MKTYTKIIAGISILASIFAFAYYVNAQNSNVSLSIIAGTNTYNVSGSINLGSHSSSFSAYSKDVVSGTFAANTFVAQDLQWSAEWTLSIKSANLVAGAHSIGSGNVFIRLNSSLNKTWDTTCNATTSLTSSWNSLNADKVWLQKTADWKICKAAIAPTIWVDIPASQPVGSYTAILTVTAWWAWAPTYSAPLTY